MKKGFTLIELLIVMAIIGIVASFAALSTQRVWQQHRARVLAQTLKTKLTLAQHQAMLQPAVMGMGIDHRSVIFFRWRTISPTQSGWEQLKRDRLLGPETIPHHVNVTLHINNQQMDLTQLSANTPYIVLQPTGDLTPFRLDIMDEGGHNHYRLFSAQNGEIMLIQQP